MSDDKALSIQRGTDGFVDLEGDQSCSPEVYQIMLEIGRDIAVPGGGSFGELEASFPVWITQKGPWSRWYIHKSSRASWHPLRPAIDKAVDLLRTRGYEVAVSRDTDEAGGPQ